MMESLVLDAIQKIVETKIIDICMKNMCIWGKKEWKKKELQLTSKSYEN